MAGLEIPVLDWRENDPDAPDTPTQGGLLAGLPSPDTSGSLALLLDPKDIADINSVPATVSEGAASSGPETAPGTYQRVAASAYDGVCRMPDGSLHPYVDRGGGYGDVYGAGDLKTDGQFGVGAAGNGAAAPVSPKRGGVAGGGKSGNATSPASRAARSLTEGARFGPLRSITGTGSIGGSIGKATPFLGGPLMWLDVLEHQNAPNCTPVPDPTAIY